eukprot:scaffold78040_cov49-Cyclotella_meneghiniana.AAC.5
MMMHLSKNRDVSVALARTEIIPSMLVNIANKMELAAQSIQGSRRNDLIAGEKRFSEIRANSYKL